VKPLVAIGAGADYILVMKKDVLDVLGAPYQIVEPTLQRACGVAPGCVRPEATRNTTYET
jgi:hypothetical protein